MRLRRARVAVAVVTVATTALLSVGGASTSAATPSVVGPPAGPAPAYDCVFNLTIGAFVGADGSASAIGWEGNHQGVVTCLGGTFLIQNGVYQSFGFGLYAGERMTWTDADGYLPAQTTAFHHDGADIAITEFADQIDVGGRPYVAVYARVRVHNPTNHVVTADPQPSAGLVALDRASVAVPAHAQVDHDYVITSDRFGSDDPWPTSAQLAASGGFDRHYAHMRAYWESQLDQIALVTTPDRALDDAYRSGFIFTEIARSGDHLDTGVNGYEAEYSHDVIGILATLFTEGDFADANALLLDARDVVGAQGQYDDGLWDYAWPWAIYLMKTGDLASVRQNFATAGAGGAAAPSIEDTAHAIAAARTGPGGIMKATDDIDTDGYWTVDDYEALMGLVAYRYLAERLGDRAEARWAAVQYDALLQATDRTLDATIRRYHLDYLPCSMVQPNTENRCANPEDANWAAPFQFGKWAWDGQLFGAAVHGPGLQLIDATYDYGFGRLQGLLPPNTFGGYPDDFYATGYNAGYGTWGLASAEHRDQAVLGYEFMIANSQAGPNSWWESSSAPAPSPWVGTHPAAGQGSAPHAWGLAEADMALLDSLVAQRADGALIVARGVPDMWLRRGRSMAVANFPTVDGRRLDLRITSDGRTVTLRLSGTPAPGPVLFEAPAFVHDIASASVGTVDDAAGVVTAPAGTRLVVVRLRRPVG